MIRCLILSLCLSINFAYAAQKTLNIFVWGNELPDPVIREFEKTTGIKVNFSTYESNEALYAKLKMTDHAYDIIEPSSYFVHRMIDDGMLATLDRSKLKGVEQILPVLAHPNYDKQGVYSVPLIWGATGIFVNRKYFDPKRIRKWSDLANKRFFNRLLLIDDPREVFSMALLAMNLKPNESNPSKIAQAYRYLVALLPNVKLYASDAISTIIADEDARVGMAWNGDVARARTSNQNIEFIYPEDGFTLWSDNLAIVKDAPHMENAYRFLNFILQPEIAKKIASESGYAIANRAGIKQLPQSVQDDPILYPNQTILKKAHPLAYVGDEAKALYEQYWEQLKTR